MPYVSNQDIIAYIDNEINFIQGNSQKYEIFLFKDLLNNALNLNQPTQIMVAVWNANERLLQYNAPFVSGSSGGLNLDLTGNTGKIDFTITAEQGAFVTAGNLFAEVSIIYENYYPQAKTYVFDKFNIGQAIADDSQNNEPTPPDNTEQIQSNRNIPVFTLEHIDLDFPSAAGKMSLNSSDPTTVSKILFKNLDKNLVRLTSLENFLSKRITDDRISGNIKLLDNSDSNLYAIYKITRWERVDLVSGNGDADNSDGIELTVVFEDQSSGPGVTKSFWEVGMDLSYELDAHGGSNFVVQGGGSSGTNGVLTYFDKGLHIAQPTSGDNSPTGINITYNPYSDSYIIVEVNGISVELGNGTKDKDVYFSANGGSSAIEIKEIRSGDELIWNGLVTGYDLTTDDEINLIYETEISELD
jgi:hypothetical protein